MAGKPTGAARRLADNAPLSDRPEWLGPRDIQEVFGVGRTKSYQIINALPHIRVGGLVRVNRRTVQRELLDCGELPQGRKKCKEKVPVPRHGQRWHGEQTPLPASRRAPHTPAAAPTPAETRPTPGARLPPKAMAGAEGPRSPEGRAPWQPRPRARQ